MNVFMNLSVSLNAGIFLTSWKLFSFSRTLLHGVSKQVGKGGIFLDQHTQRGGLSAAEPVNVWIQSLSK